MQILCVGSLPIEVTSCFHTHRCRITFCPASASSLDFLRQEAAPPNMILYKLDKNTTQAFMRLRHAMLKEEKWCQVPFVAISHLPTPRIRQLAKRFQVTAHFNTFHTATPAWCRRLRMLLRESTLDEQALSPIPAALHNPNTKIPAWKRVLDVVGASVLILLLSPLLLLTAALIKLESRGPILYISKRAGQNFKVFDFYKFRSMRTDADRQLDTIRQDSAYREHADEPRSNPSTPQRNRQPLLQDTGFIDESAFQRQKEVAERGTFIKVQGDPRVSSFGWLIRKTSIDELPQLFNVLKGDMSLVGNRPLPLYEAEKLTQDEYIARFFGPAGITGLWQITKRSKVNLSPEERKLLDVRYALNYDLWMDLKILWKTLPAALQRENA